MRQKQAKMQALSLRVVDMPALLCHRAACEMSQFDTAGQTLICMC
jgi:hypothetical protein